MKTGNFIKIQDGTIIRRESLTGYHKELYNPRGFHYYIAIQNENRGYYDMYPTSHYIDPKKQTDVRKGRAILMNIKGVKGLSTVYKQPRTKDIHGQRFGKDFNKYEFVTVLSDFQKKRLKSFLNKK